MKLAVVAVLVAVSLGAAIRSPAGDPSVFRAVGSGSIGADRRIQDPVPGSYAWPVVGPVIRGFEPPSGPFGPGHRGIDIAVPFGSPVRAAADGVVAFAGWVAGSLYVSVDHADGVRTTYSWLSSESVRKGDTVHRGEVIAASGHGHPEIQTPHLHFGARIGSTYIDPMILLGGADVSGLIRLAPLDGSS